MHRGHRESATGFEVECKCYGLPHEIGQRCPLHDGPGQCGHDLVDIATNAHGAGQVDALKSIVDYLMIRLRRMGENPLPPHMSVFAWPYCKPWCGLPMREALVIAEARGIDGGGVRNFKSLQRPGYLTQVFCSQECRNRFARGVHVFSDDGTGNCVDCGNGPAFLGHAAKPRERAEGMKGGV